MNMIPTMMPLQSSSLPLILILLLPLPLAFLFLLINTNNYHKKKNPPNSNSIITLTTRSPSSIHPSSSSTGHFDRLPSDVFLLIVKLLDPRDAATLSAVCKSWNCLISDNRLWIYFLKNRKDQPWDSIFFAETHLRSLNLHTQTQAAHLSFKHIFGCRVRVPGAVLIDGIST